MTVVLALKREEKGFEERERKTTEKPCSFVQYLKVIIVKTFSTSEVFAMWLKVRLKRAPTPPRTTLYFALFLQNLT